jgi:hypothetical protein
MEGSDGVPTAGDGEPLQDATASAIALVASLKRGSSKMPYRAVPEHRARPSNLARERNARRGANVHPVPGRSDIDPRGLHHAIAALRSGAENSEVGREHGLGICGEEGPCLVDEHSLEVGGAHLAAERSEKCEALRATKEQTVRTLRERPQHAELVRELCAADDGDE